MKKPLEGDTAPATDRASVADHVAALLARLHPQVSLERRRDDRFPLPVLMHLVPLDDEHAHVEEEAVTVVGKNISRRGISFFHEHPLEHRRVILELSDNELGHFTFEVDVTWCRFTKPGWYESGGRLVRVHTCADAHATEDFTKVELTPLASDLHQNGGSFVVANHVL